MANLGTAAQRVGSTSELIYQIARFSTHRDNASNLFVSKSWSHEVLNIEWRNVETATMLFRLIGSIVTRSDCSVTFRHPLGPDSWVRLDAYAWRIWSLRIYSKTQDYDGICEIIQRDKPTDVLLPNLRELIVNFSAGAAILRAFAHPKLSSLSIISVFRWNPRQADPIEHLTLVANSLPNLRFLSISCPGYDALDAHKDIVLESTLCSTFQALQGLRCLVLPPQFLSPAVSGTLCTLPELASLASHRDHMQLKRAPLATFSSELHSNAFPSLQELVLKIPFDRASECFRGSYQPNSIVKLSLRSNTVEPVGSVSRTLFVVSRGCPRLEEFILMDSHTGGLQEGSQITLDTLRPLMECPKMRRLRLTHHNVLKLSGEDVLQFLSAFPLIVELSLNPQPFEVASWVDESLPPTSDIIHISILSTIATLHPSLEILGLFFVASVVELPEDKEVASFPRLRRLELGDSQIHTSTVEDERRLALYLARVVGEYCPLHFSKLRGTTSRKWTSVAPLVTLLANRLNLGESYEALLQALVAGSGNDPQQMVRFPFGFHNQ
ncbi:hypothetical protein ONZ45_g11580 [Pleurotus djamor]|nr:hypothetical protein ONZ45_g11580 [Pleurotus djamor]